MILEDIETQMKKIENSTTDLICGISSFIMIFSYPVFPVILARGTKWISPNIWMSKHLKWPKYGYMLLLSELTFFVGYIFMIVVKEGEASNHIHTTLNIQLLIFVVIPAHNYEATSIQWTFLLSYQLCGIFLYIIFFSLFLIPLTWLEKISSDCNELSIEVNILKFNNIIAYYNSLQEGLELLIFILFNFCQLSIIVNLFNSISYPFHASEVPYERFLWVIVFLCFSFHYIFLILAITLTAENSYHQVTGLEDPLKDKLCKNLQTKAKIDHKIFVLDLAEDQGEKFEIQKVLDKIDKLKPLSGKGFFFLTRNNLTSMLSISVTYLIILLQFKLS